MLRATGIDILCKPACSIAEAPAATFQLFLLRATRSNFTICLYLPDDIVVVEVPVAEIPSRHRPADCRT